MKQLLTSFNLSIAGLQISYSANNSQNILNYDSKATCDLFEDLRIIEGFEIDYKTGEPVILGMREHDYEDQEGFVQWTSSPVAISWCDYITTYPFTHRHAELLAEELESNTAHRKILGKINSLLFPKIETMAPREEAFA